MSRPTAPPNTHLGCERDRTGGDVAAGVRDHGGSLLSGSQLRSALSCPALAAPDSCTLSAQTGQLAWFVFHGDGEIRSHDSLLQFFRACLGEPAGPRLPTAVGPTDTSTRVGYS